MRASFRRKLDQAGRSRGQSMDDAVDSTRASSSKDGALRHRSDSDFGPDYNQQRSKLSSRVENAEKDAKKANAAQLLAEQRLKNGQAALKRERRQWERERENLHRAIKELEKLVVGAELQVVQKGDVDVDEVVHEVTVNLGEVVVDRTVAGVVGEDVEESSGGGHGDGGGGAKGGGEGVPHKKSGPAAGGAPPPNSISSSTSMSLIGGPSARALLTEVKRQQQKLAEERHLFGVEKHNVEQELEKLRRQKTGLEAKVALMNEVGKDLKENMKSELARVQETCAMELRQCEKKLRSEAEAETHSLSLEKTELTTRVRNLEGELADLERRCRGAVQQCREALAEAFDGRRREGAVLHQRGAPGASQNRDSSNHSQDDSTEGDGFVDVGTDLATQIRTLTNLLSEEEQRSRRTERVNNSFGSSAGDTSNISAEAGINVSNPDIGAGADAMDLALPQLSGAEKTPDVPGAAVAEALRAEEENNRLQQLKDLAAQLEEAERQHAFQLEQAKKEAETELETLRTELEVQNRVLGADDLEKVRGEAKRAQELFEAARAELEVYGETVFGKFTSARSPNRPNFRDLGNGRM